MHKTGRLLKNCLCTQKLYPSALANLVYKRDALFLYDLTVMWCASVFSLTCVLQEITATKHLLHSTLKGFLILPSA